MKSAQTIALTIAILLPSAANAAKVHVLYNFTGGSDGAYPTGELVGDRAGNLYGTALGGGIPCDGGGCGTIFKLSPDGTLTVVYAFQDGNDGAHPIGDLVMDKAGSLYGVTVDGGGASGCYSGDGCGIVFSVKPQGTEKVLYALQGGSDGDEPVAGLAVDSSGNLYGTTVYGGGTGCAGYGCGTVFKIGHDGNESVLHAFILSPTDGGNPFGALILDSAGILYGTTNGGGANSTGTIFKLAADGSEAILYSFNGETDGYWPAARLFRDRLGNLYGTTTYGGGAGTACVGYFGDGCGTVFKLAPDLTYTVLHAFNGSEGAVPMAPLSVDKAGILHGTTYVGGDTGRGTAFNVSTDGAFSLVHSFHKRRDGGFLRDGLFVRGNKLYGTALYGGAFGRGTVFELTY